MSDEPRKAVQEADALVSDTIKRLSEVFANERQNLEQQWGRNENVSTEDLARGIAKIPLIFLAASGNLKIWQVGPVLLRSCGILRATIIAPARIQVRWGSPPKLANPQAQT